ncbi:alpha/beta fold hydrolase [Yinghuangia sp. ASG 101]|uniref:alpha/beta fold hydrolase n=1 Tax=Yinghuangia sp. ASG 101 TaxID=2896848 RepID=UPI001E566E7E|nr:alpha/beta fold hydrolase [Yinghuangia sp. ASG 101]UGQ09398.1 alpha/beta fold hydrolase [Yinghuangia sp. ASG 101]
MTWRTALTRRLPGSRRARVVTVVVAALAVLALGAVALASGDGDGGSSVRSSDERVSVAAAPGSAERIQLDTTVFWPDTGEPAPAVLLGHGFGGSKATVRSDAADLARRGFVVMTWSARGFGSSGGLIALDQPDYEVADARALVDWLAARPEVRLDGPGDPRVGAAGASYGGALALLLAAYDARVDAVASQWTWHDLADALLPNATGAGPDAGVFKKMWAGVFFSAGATSIASSTAGGGPAAVPGDTASVCGRFAPEVCAVYDEVARTGRATPQAVELLRRASPGPVADRIRVPTLLIQGQNDSLFPLAEADRTARAVTRNGFPVEVAWTSGGHDGGSPQTARVRDRTAAWFDRWIASDTGVAETRQRRAGTESEPAPAGPFSVTRLGGVDTSTREQVVRVASGPVYPGIDGSRRTEVGLTGPEQTVVNPPGGSPPSMSSLPGLGLLGTLGQLGDAATATGGFSLDMPGQSAFFTSEPLDRPVRVTGASSVRVRVSGADDIVLFAKLYDVDPSGGAALPYQLAAPLRVVGARDGRDVEIRLPAIDREIDSRHRLRLVLTATDLGYATPEEPAAYRVAVTGPLVVPSVPGLKPQPPGYPWWTWGLPAAAVAAGAVIVVTGRRRAAARAPRADLADVPLRISGLTKRYKGGKLAVDDLSFEVERGRVLGLLGPNGAGKTTTLRMLMGLIHPDEGEIRIFGHAVTPGAPVLSRLGSFVEGPGFLPHLSGRDNLELYWRATGRPAEDAHVDEALDIAGLGEALDRAVRTYSQGMRQRLAIAQAMLGLPDLLVLDEPTNGLDPPQIRAMRDVLVRYATGDGVGRTVVVSSHLLAEVEQTCTHVVVMHRGRLVASGPVAAITGDGNSLAVGTPDPDRAVDVLASLPGIVTVTPEGDGVLVHLAGAEASAVVAELVGAGVPVDRVVAKRRLEDVFLTLIGDGQ